MSPRKVPISTSTTSPSPCGASRRNTAYTIGIPTQRTPKKVAASAHETCSRRGRKNESQNTSGNDGRERQQHVPRLAVERRGDHPAERRGSPPRFTGRTRAISV